MRPLPAPRLLLPLCLAVALASGCTRVPELETQVPAALHDAEYPKLIPLGPELLEPETPSEEAARLEGELNARRQGLLARAARLRSPILSPEEEKRLNRTIPIPRAE